MNILAYPALKKENMFWFMRWMLMSPTGKSIISADVLIDWLIKNGHPEVVARLVDSEILNWFKQVAPFSLNSKNSLVALTIFTKILSFLPLKNKLTLLITSKKTQQWCNYWKFKPMTNSAQVINASNFSITS